MSAWAEEGMVTIATATFNGKNATYTEGWSTTGTGTGRTDCVIIGSGENITSPAFDLSGYSEVSITFTGRRYGSLTGSKATVNASIGGTSAGTIDFTSTTVGAVSGSISFTPTNTMTSAVLVFTCTNATSAGSTHGAGVGSITIKGTVAKDLSSIAISGNYPTSFYTGDDFTTEGATVTATYSDNTTADVTSKATFTGYDMETAGTQSVTVSYTESGVTKTTSYSITVTERPRFTVILDDDDTELAEAAAGAGVTLPTRENVGSYVFKGWTATELSNETTVTPTIIEAGAYSPTANITLYPVYQCTDGISSTHSVNIGEYATANEWTTESGNGQYYSLAVDDAITVSVTNSGNNGKVYTNSDVVNWRIYSGATLTITSTAENIVSIKIDTQDSGFGLYYGEILEKRGTAFEVTAAKTVELSATATARISAMEIVTSNATIYYTSYPSATITLASACTDGTNYFGTYSNESAFVVPADLTVSEVSVIDGALYVDEYQTGAVVPANTGVMVSSATAGDHTVMLSSETGTSVLGEDNMLKASSVAMTGNCLFYRLTMHNNETIGFWWGADEGAAFTIAANKAYLAVPKTANARMGFTFGGATGIEAVEKSTVAADRCYDLQGRRVMQPTKGLYIVNGKKVIIK